MRLVSQAGSSLNGILPVFWDLGFDSVHIVILGASQETLRIADLLYIGLEGSRVGPRLV